MAEQLAFWEALSALQQCRPGRPWEILAIHRPERVAFVPPATPPAPPPEPAPAPVKVATKPRSKSTRARRTCLTCGSVFSSSGPGNRRCRSCRRHDAYTDNIAEYAVQF